MLLAWILAMVTMTSGKTSVPSFDAARVFMMVESRRTTSGSATTELALKSIGRKSIRPAGLPSDSEPNPSVK